MNTIDDAQRAPRVLVAFASRHGSTEAIAREIAGRLQAGGCAPTTRSAELVEDPAAFDAYVVGSAVYMGRWMPAARDFVTRNQRVLMTKPVWLFSSGPVGSPARPETGPNDGAVALAEVRAIEHRVLPGRLDHSVLSFPERIAVQVVGAPDGDFRDWAAIHGWADTIAAELLRRLAGTPRVGV
ncbi:MAG: flavodoxin domain-containing protein [Bauldia sp.]|nr:flavodoxin domain-containing protein [Bauldia sp.]MCW5717629.1 flavodoxin domain-containing protein [Bauldia sp.]MCW5929965.1 flavodoxin domain-containing protein [Chitinophagaceae bacterium]